MINIFGIRHLSPRASAEIDSIIRCTHPKAVLIELPLDLQSFIPVLLDPETVFPVALFAHTSDKPFRSFTAPLAEYSPELIAAKVGVETGAATEFIDFPSGVVLAQNNAFEDVYSVFLPENEDFDDYFERNFEHLPDGVYQHALLLFGRTLRSLSPVPEAHLLRERYMRGRIAAAERLYGDVLVVCGAYHAPALLPVSGEDAVTFEKVETVSGVMPYSYMRMTEYSGYGAGYNSPLYYETLWRYSGNRDKAAASFLSAFAPSPGVAADALLTARAIAAVKNSPVTLSDLRRSAAAVFGQGSEAYLAKEFAMAEVGTVMGALPKSYSNAPLREDFYSEIKRLRLSRFLSPAPQTLRLDYRKSDLETKRGVFLHRLRVIGAPFAMFLEKNTWSVAHRPEIDILLSALPYESIEAAATHCLLERSGAVITDAALCDLPETLKVPEETADFTVKDLEEISSGILFYELDMLRPALEKLFTSRCSRILNETGEMESLDKIARDHGYGEVWQAALMRTVRSVNNYACAGYAAAHLISRGGNISIIPAHASLAEQNQWFGGVMRLLAQKNVFAAVDAYIAALEEDDFQEKLLIFRRNTSKLSYAEKTNILSKCADPRRWTMILGEENHTYNFTVEEHSIASALSNIYSDSVSGKSEGTAAILFKALKDLGCYFTGENISIAQSDVLQRIDRVDVDALKTFLPDEALATVLISAKNKLSSTHEAREIVRRVVAQLEHEISADLKSAVYGSISHRCHSIVNTRSVDFHGTIMKNLSRYNHETGKIVPERLLFFDKSKGRFEKHFILAIDQSGSMIPSALYGAAMGSVLASVNTVSTRLLVFDSGVADVTGADPVDTLFSAHLTGGTDIEKALNYCGALITEPKKTILMLISDLYDNKTDGAFIDILKKIKKSGTEVVVLLPFNEQGYVSYNKKAVSELSAAGVSCCASRGNFSFLLPSKRQEDFMEAVL